MGYELGNEQDPPPGPGGALLVVLGGSRREQVEQIRVQCGELLGLVAGVVAWVAVGGTGAWRRRVRQGRRLGAAVGMALRGAVDASGGGGGELGDRGVESNHVRRGLWDKTWMVRRRGSGGEWRLNGTWGRRRRRASLDAAWGAADASHRVRLTRGAGARAPFTIGAGAGPVAAELVAAASLARGPVRARGQVDEAAGRIHLHSGDDG